MDEYSKGYPIQCRRKARSYGVLNFNCNGYYNTIKSMQYVKGLKKDIILSEHSTYKIGGPADYFLVAKNINDILAALKFSDENSLPVFILAGGSNILFSDEGFRGLVIKIENKEIKIRGDKITAEAGVMMAELINVAIGAKLAGLEWAGGLPGTFGGAVRGNAGCFGGEIKNTIEQVTAVTRSGKLKYYSNEDCCFSYRDSVFKRNDEIIISAVLSLRSGDPEKLREEVFGHIKHRQERQPLEFPNCGSVFKNCPLEIVPEAVARRFKEKIKTDPFPILPVAVLADAGGLKGRSIGGAKISEKLPSFIVNFKNASASDVLELMSVLKEKIKKEFDINLQEEIELVGF